MDYILFKRQMSPLNELFQIKNKLILIFLFKKINLIILKI